MAKSNGSVKGGSESPFSEYPGTLRFPEHFTGAHYKAFLEANKKQDDDPDNDVWRLVPYWRVGLTLAIEKPTNIPTSFDAAPIELIRWVKREVSAYLDPLLMG